MSKCVVSGLSAKWFVTFTDGSEMSFHSVRDMCDNFQSRGIPVNVECLFRLTKRLRAGCQLTEASFDKFRGVVSILNPSTSNRNILERCVIRTLQEEAFKDYTAKLSDAYGDVEQEKREHAAYLSKLVRLQSQHNTKP